MTRSSEKPSREVSNEDGKVNGNATNDCNNNEDGRDQADKPDDRRERSRHRRRSSGNAKHGELAAADSEAKPPPPKIPRAFYTMLTQGAQVKKGEGSIEIDTFLAANILEAAAGNLTLAANLYWDNHFAIQAARKANPQETKPRDRDDMERKPAAAPRGGGGGAYRSARFSSNDDAGGDDLDYLNDETDGANARCASSRSSPGTKAGSIFDGDHYSSAPKRRLRRSLDSDFEAADDDDETKKKKKAAKRARKSNESARNDPGDDQDEDDQKMPAIPRNANHDGTGSDREGRPRQRRRRNPGFGMRSLDIEAEENSGDGSDDKEDQDDETNRHEAQLGELPRGREEPQRIFALAGAETSINVSDDELGRVVKNPQRRMPSSRRRADPSSNSTGNKHGHDDVTRSAVMKAVNDIHRKINPNITHLSKASAWLQSPELRRRRLGRDNDGDSVDSNTEDYISDDDWIGVDTYSFPMDLLWAANIDKDPDPYISKLLKRPSDDTINERDPGDGNVVAEDETMNVPGEDEDSYPDCKFARSVQTGEPFFSGIPHTWMNAGFELSECGSGLVIKSPKVEDIEFFAWRQKQVNDKRNSVPPPYYCKSLTAITSIVTGLLYSGVSVQGNEVNCTAGKPSWASLTPEERKREFESRLLDALSALLFVAAQASLKRKKKAYRKAIRACNPTNVEVNCSKLLREAIAGRNFTMATDDGNKADKKSETKNNDVPVGNNNSKKSSAETEGTDWKQAAAPTEKKTVPSVQGKKEMMRRRLDVIPTCIWADRKAALAPRAGDGHLMKANITVQKSWTNIRDIKLYVKSYMKSFTEKGGIALFLETLVGIHGKKFIARELKRSAVAKASVSSSDGKETEKETADADCKPNDCKPNVYAGLWSLIHCTCEHRQKKMQDEKPLPLNVRIDPNKLLDTTPPGNDCVSVELLTLILTGRVYSDLKECSSGNLGIGLLTDNIGEVSQSLARPKHPVWVLKGELGYSVLTIEGCWSNGVSGSRMTDSSSYKEDVKTISKVDKPGVPLNLCHWNGWYGQRNKTEMRLVTSKSGIEHPSKKLLSVHWDHHRGKRMSTSLRERRVRENIIGTISGEEHKSNENKEKENPICAFELERIKIHSEDQKLYPRNYKIWRFDPGINDDENSSTMDKKQPAQNWIPYYRLTSRQKRMVEIKLGPKINTILWTRWPNATIDNFTPNDGGFPVV